MLDYDTVKLLHRHEGEWFPLKEVAHHDPAEHDPERTWPSNTKLFRCAACAEEIAIAAPGHETPGDRR